MSTGFKFFLLGFSATIGAVLIGDELRSDEPVVPERDEVVIVGDALVFHDADPDGSDVAEALDARVAGFEGQTIVDAHEHLWPDLEGTDRVEVLVVALGSVDAHVVDGERLVPLSESRDAMRLWLYQAQSVPCVVLVEVNENATEWGLDQSGPRHNEMLVEAARDFHPNARVMEWSDDAATPFVTAQDLADYRDALTAEIEECRS